MPWGNRSYNATIKQFPVQYQLMLEWKKGNKIEQLFDMAADPWAMRDISKDRQHRAALDRMRKSLDEWQSKTGDNQMPRSTQLQSESGQASIDDLKPRQIAGSASSTPAAQTAGWQPNGYAKLTLQPGALHLASSGSDPFIFADAIPVAEGAYTLELRMRSTLDTVGEVFWSVAPDPAFSPDRMVPFAVQANNEWHNYVVEIPEANAVRSLRIDPGQTRGEVTFEFIRLIDAQKKVVKEWSFGIKRGQ